MTGPPPTPRPNLKPWAIGAAVVVILGVAASLVTGGGGDGPGTYKTLAAGDANVAGIHYRVVAATPAANAPKQGPLPLYFNEYTGNPPKLVERFVVPGVSFYADSVIASLKLRANPDRTAALTFSWFHHAGDRTNETKRYRVTKNGIQLY